MGMNNMARYYLEVQKQEATLGTKPLISIARFMHCKEGKKCQVFAQH